MKLLILAASSLLAGFCFVTTGSVALAFTGQEMAKDAKVTIRQASAIALKARPGKITDRELEREVGGSGLRYSFDVKSRGVTYEVGVDAVTGKVLENKTEGLNPD